MKESMGKETCIRSFQFSENFFLQNNKILRILTLYHTIPKFNITKECFFELLLEKTKIISKLNLHWNGLLQMLSKWTNLKSYHPVKGYTCITLPRWLSGERVGLMTWWLWVWSLVEANFLSSVFSPLTSVEAYEKSSLWLLKEKLC